MVSDNQAVVKIIEKRSMHPDLQKIALDIFEIMMKNAISLEMQWTPRDQNDRADYISKIVDVDDWGICEKTFRAINCDWGPHEVDWFASWHNYKLPTFYSRYWNPGSAGVDAFSFHWGDRTGWFVPPVYLFTRVIKHMKNCKSKGTLVVPYWKSGRFWPILCPDGLNFIPAIKDMQFLPTEKCCFTPSRSGRGIFLIVI